MRHRIAILGLGFLAFSMPVSDLLAQAQPEEAKGIVAVRQKTMSSFSGHAQSIQKILTEAPELIEQVPLHADAIVSLAPHIPTLFPAGSDQEPTRALPAIWQNPDDFASEARELGRLAGEVSQTAKGGDARETLAAFANMGRQGCGSCHETYREKEN
jgi:cytochrome c556